jgi:hypothetical protein
MQTSSILVRHVRAKKASYKDGLIEELARPPLQACIIKISSNQISFRPRAHLLGVDSSSSRMFSGVE